MRTGSNSVSADTSPYGVAEIVERDGYAVVKALASDVVRRSRDDLAPHIEAAPWGHTPFLGSRTKRVPGLVAKSRAVQELAIHPLVLAVADCLLLPRCARYQLNFSGVMHLAPGAGAQGLHRDGSFYPFAQPFPTVIMPTMWAVSDFTAENGGTQIVPGSHLWDSDREPLESEIVSAEMPAGSVLIYTSGVLHGGGENRASESRTGIALQYALAWLRQEENQFLANPPEVAREFPERLQRLIGYDYAAPYLGFVNGDDPHRLLEGPYDGPPQRSNPSVDAAYERVTPQRYGDVEPVSTPSAPGKKVATLSRLAES